MKFVVTVVSLVSIGIFAALCLYFYPYMTDDAYISLRYADRFMHGKGLTWNDGEYVEGYSNLLWILALSAFSAITRLNLELASYAVNLMAAAGCMALLVYHARSMKLHPFAFLGGIALLACNIPFAVWSIAGLETVLYSFLLLFSYIKTIEWLQSPRRRCEWELGSLLALLVMCRPEGIVFTPVFIGLSWFFSSPRRLPRVAALVPVVVCVALELFRIIYYHAWLPNTFYVKVAFNGQRFLEGLEYLHTGLFVHWPWLLYVAAYVLLSARILRQWKTPLIVLCVVASCWTALVVVAGGDIFPAHRHLVPVFVLAAAALLFMLQAAFLRFPDQKSWILTGLICAVVYSLLVQWKDYDHNLRIKYETVWIEKCRLIGKYFARQFPEAKPTIAVTAAGAIPYFSKLPAIDLFGLNDPYLRHTPPQTFGHGQLAHELYTSDYLAWRLPEIIMFSAGIDLDMESMGIEAYYYPKVVELPNKVWSKNNKITFFYRIDFPDVQ